MSNNYKKTQKNYSASGTSLANLNSMGANYLTQTYGVEKITKKDFECIDVQVINTIFLGQIISPYKIQIKKRFSRCWKIFLYFFYNFWKFFSIFVLFFPKKRLGF